jgi:hypothetical protein
VLEPKGLFEIVPEYPPVLEYNCGAMKPDQDEEPLPVKVRVP